MQGYWLSNFPHRDQSLISISEASAAQGGIGNAPPQRARLHSETQKGWGNRRDPTHTLRNFANRFNGKEGLTITQTNLQGAKSWKFFPTFFPEMENSMGIRS